MLASWLVAMLLGDVEAPPVCGWRGFGGWAVVGVVVVLLLFGGYFGDGCPGGGFIDDVLV